ncbi:MAG: pyruvate formate lyase-activating protein [Chloroflexi bacterium]|nr:pyruvate formate lyase-activating protein [Chloroflexota bacterium]
MNADAIISSVMRILAVDMGTGTQDILLFDSAQPVENALQMIMPSATEIAAHRIRAATRERRAVVLTGVTAGGGPCHWALEAHLKAGLPALATPEAAKTFDDDLDNVQRMGVTLLSEDEVDAAQGEHIPLRDLDLDAIRTAFSAFDVDTRFDGLALGCLDHGASPPGYSDRLFRFDHLRRVVAERNDLRAFAYLPDELPEYLTRARTLLAAADADAPTVFLDTGPAAALGALQDSQVAAHQEQLLLNLGNMHALAFHLHGTRILSLYEHHTGEVSADQFVDFTQRLIAGTLRHEDVFESKGHGVYYADGPARPEPVERPTARPFLAVTGPQRAKLRGSVLDPYFAVPHGDMMVSGCFGLLWAFAEKHPQHSDEILEALGISAALVA